MPWLWFAGPFVVLVIYLLMSLWPTNEERRIQREVQRWLDDFIGPLHIGNKTRSRRVRHLPPAFVPLLEEVGGGTRVTDAVLVPKQAYFVARIADGLTSSNHFAVVGELAKAAPKLACRPLPIVDGRPAQNRGISFDDPEFMDLFQVEGESAKDVKKWLRNDLREAFTELPEAWLRVRGKVFALSVYGAADADKIDALVDLADAIFAEHGASAASLFGDESTRRTETVERGYRREAEEIVVPKQKGDKGASDQPSDEAPPALRLKASAIDFALYAMAGLLMAAVSGQFASFHPSVLFTSPDIVVTEPWQGGWTTKGVGAFFVAETFLVGLFVLQSYLGAAHGLSIGMRLLGARVVNEDGKAPGFLRGVLMRRWIFGAVPLLVAAVLARPFSAWHFVEKLVSWPAVITAAAVVVALGGLLARGEALMDRLSKTRVVLADRWRLPSVQLGVAKEAVDPVAFNRLLRVGALVLGFAVINFAVIVLLDASWWPFQAPYRAIDAIRPR